MAKKAKGFPTKQLFLDALISDLDVVEAIEDLVDNSVDAAMALRGKNRFEGLWIKVHYTVGEFSIEDNCGGMSVNIAENVAFRLGRPAGYTGTPGQIGRFGIGMKRDLFLLGKEIAVSSKTKNSSLKVEISVPNWLKQGESDWDFPFTEISETVSHKDEETGTRISVKTLNDEARQKFKDPNFHAELVDALQKKHKASVENGMHITVNSTPLAPQPYQLRQSENVEPAHFALNLNGHGRATVKVRLLAGVDEPKPKEAGWYIACNGRFILIADQSIKTGWGETGTVIIPKMHGQFSRFRGFAFFECEDPTRLPWNSTKTGLNTESAVYRPVRELMINACRPVIDFLNEIDKELEADERPLNDALAKAKPKPVSLLLAENVQATRKNFRAAPLDGQQDPERPIRISYTKPLREVKKVRRKLGTEDNREVGSQTFDYFHKYECR